MRTIDETDVLILKAARRVCDVVADTDDRAAGLASHAKSLISDLLYVLGVEPKP